MTDRQLPPVEGAQKKGRHADDADSFALKYGGSFPVHDAVTANDLDAVISLASRKDTDAYDQNGWTPIHIAALNGYDEIIKVLLKFNADVSGPERTTGRTALHFACLGGHHSTAQLLLKKGAVLYDKDKAGTFPMHLAAEGGNADVIILLKNSGAPISCLDRNEAEPIHYAARHNRLSAMAALQQLGADLDSQDRVGATSMHYAAVENHSEAIVRLAELGADVNSICDLGETPLFYATKGGNLEAITALAYTKCDMNARSDNGECAIHVAAKLDLWKPLHQLVKLGVDVATPYKKNKQAIHIAAESGSCEVIKLMKKLKADLDAQDKHGNRPLHYAVWLEQLAAIQKLAEMGADLNAPRKRGQTALHVAVKEKHAKIVNLLCSLGADCNVEDENCLAPLYYAAVNGDPATGQTLRRYGAHVNKLNSEGDGMAHIMVEEERLEGLNTLKDLKANFSIRNKEGDTCVHLAAASMQVNVLKRLKHIGADLNMRNKNGLIAVHVAAMAGKGETVDLLNDLGADLNFKTEDFKRDATTPRLSRLQWLPGDVMREELWKHRVGLTPVHLALLHGHREILSHLVECGADINQADASGETAFHLAVLFNMTDWLQPLLSFGADRNCKDILGRSPLHYAAHTGNLDILRLLLKYGANITEIDHEGRQPLHYAAQEGHYLLFPEFTAQNRDVDLNCLDNSGRTPLHFACEKGMVDAIRELVHLKADIHTTDQDDNTVIHTAAIGGAYETIVLLASLGCSMDVQNKNLQTPLHVAAEHGQGETMDYLLMCGGNPNIKDKNDLLPNTYKLQGPIKHTIVRRIRQYNEHHSNEHKTGEVGFDGRIVPSGKVMDFDKLGIRVALECGEDVAPFIFIHRTPPTARQLEIPLGGLEEILSDVYEMRVLCLHTVCTLTLEIPVDGYPGKFESFLRTASNDEYKEFTTSEENGVPMFIGKIPVGKCFASKFAVVVRPRVYVYHVGSEASTIISDLDRRIRLEIPAGAFDENVDLDFQVLKTDNTECSVHQLFATDVVSVDTHGVQPRKRLKLQLPLHARGPEQGDNWEDTDDMVVFAIQNEADLQDEHRWRIIQSHLKYANDCVTFSIEHCSIYVASMISHLQRNLAMDARKRLVKERVKLAVQRETSVLFFYAVCQRKNAFLTIFECTTPGKFKRRSEYWENEGFQLHPVMRHSGHFVAKPNQQYHFSVTGNFQYLDGDLSKMTLTFNPRSYKYHSFYMQRVDRKKPLIGEFQVTTVGNDGDEVPVTSLPIEVPTTSGCKLS